MTKHRRSSIKRDNAKRKRLGIKGVCRYCGGVAKPPRRTFCSDSCVHEWKLRSDVKYMRSYVYDRDLGQCAICSVDTRYTKINVENTLRNAKSRSGKLYAKDQDLISLLKDLNITLSESVKTLWHADHIIAVKDGGGECGLDNIRTLCIKCHKTVTKLSRSAPQKSSPAPGRYRAKRS